MCDGNQPNILTVDSNVNVLNLITGIEEYGKISWGFDSYEINETINQRVFTDGEIVECPKKKHLKLNYIYINDRKYEVDEISIRRVLVRDASYIIKATYEEYDEYSILANVELIFVGKPTIRTYMDAKKTYLTEVLQENSNLIKPSRFLENPFGILPKLNTKEKRKNKIICVENR